MRAHPSPFRNRITVAKFTNSEDEQTECHRESLRVSRIVKKKQHEGSSNDWLAPSPWGGGLGRGSWDAPPQSSFLPSSAPFSPTLSLREGGRKLGELAPETFHEAGDKALHLARPKTSTPICNKSCGKSINTQFSAIVSSVTRHQSITRMPIGFCVAGAPR